MPSESAVLHAMTRNAHRQTTEIVSALVRMGPYARDEFPPDALDSLERAHKELAKAMKGMGVCA